MTSFNGAVVLVTGANGGIGTHFVREALARGAAKVYATARNPREWDDERIVPLTLDVTDPASIRAVVEQTADVTVLINNAGASPSTPGILTHTDEEIRSNVETNFLGPLFLARAFAPLLSARGGNTAIIDIHSALSWYAVMGIYSATKAALWSVTNSLRLELQPAGVQVVGCTSAGSTPPWQPVPPTPRPTPPSLWRRCSMRPRPASTKSSPTRPPCRRRRACRHLSRPSTRS